ncbi:ABC transporter permease [Microbacterium esteraromaticum]|uniref:ABC transporter permease n=1 Tax=Microbacterium esteraromaticum TaxID=57043 RepID=UPI002175424A|nr:hypothetical protein [Microbacterium esteraromaticum]
MTTLTNAQRVTGPSKRPPWIRRRWSTVLTLALLLIVLLGYVIGPMIATARRSVSQDKAAVLGFSFKAWSDFFANPTQTSAIGGSIVLSLLSVLCAGVLGTLVAILLTRWDFPGRRICQVLALLPIALPRSWACGRSSCCSASAAASPTPWRHGSASTNRRSGCRASAECSSSTP